MKVENLIDLTKVLYSYKEFLDSIKDKEPSQLSTSDLTLLRQVSTGSISSAKKNGRTNEDIILMDKFAIGTKSNCGKNYGINDDLLVMTMKLAKLFGTVNIKEGWTQWAKVNHPDRGGDTATFQRVKQQYEDWTKVASNI